MYNDQEYYFVPNGSSCYLYTDVADMKQHNPQVKKWAHTTSINSVKSLRATPLFGHTKKRVSASTTAPAKLKSADQSVRRWRLSEAQENQLREASQTRYSGTFSFGSGDMPDKSDFSLNDEEEEPVGVIGDQNYVPARTISAGSSWGGQGGMTRAAARAESSVSMDPRLLPPGFRVKAGESAQDRFSHEIGHMNQQIRAETAAKVHFKYKEKKMAAKRDNK